MSVAEVADALAARLGLDHGWVPAEGAQPPEMEALALDSAAAGRHLGWRPRLATADAIDWTACWYRDFAAGADARALTLGQITAYEALA
jgi:CDP-glucose 4,6-dehydratase